MVKMNQKKSDLIRFFGIILIVIATITGSYYYSFKLDVTEDERFTLKEETKELLGDVDEIITFKVYLDGENLPVGFVKLKNSIKEMLTEFAYYSDETIEFEFVDLFEIKDREKREKEIQRLIQIGIPYLPVKQNKESVTNEFYVIPGAEVLLGEKVIGVTLLENNTSVSYQQNFNNSIEALEYQLSNAIRKLKMSSPKKVAFLQGHGESGQMQLQDIAQTLSEYYIVGPILMSDENNEVQLDALDYIDLLIISKPLNNFNPKELYVLDQFVIRGGKLICMLEGVSAHLDSLRYSNFFPAMPLKTQLEDLLFSYGVRVENNLVQDLRCTQIPLQATGEGSMAKANLTPWVFFPLILSEENHLINQKLDPLKLEFASTLVPIKVDNVNATTILKTSGQNNYLQTPTRIGFEEALSGINPKAFLDTAKAVSILLEGNFTSYFKNRPREEFNSGVPHIDVKQLGKENKILVISDGDFGVNPIISGGQALPLGTDRYNQFITYDNKRFLLNAVNYMLGDSDLIPVRSKKIQMRLLDKEKLKNEIGLIKIINLLGPILLVCILGIVFFMIRKKSFGK